MYLYFVSFHNTIHIKIQYVLYIFTAYRNLLIIDIQIYKSNCLNHSFAFIPMLHGTIQLNCFVTET